MAGQTFYFDVVNGTDVKIGVQGFAEFERFVAVIYRFQTIFELVGDFDEKISSCVDVVFRIGQEGKPRFYFVFVDRNVFSGSSRRFWQSRGGEVCRSVFLPQTAASRSERLPG